MATGIFLRKLFIKIFAIFFYTLAIAVLVATGVELLTNLSQHQSIMMAFITTIESTIIALAVFELGLVIDKEYDTLNQENSADSPSANSTDDTIGSLKRTLPRFVGTVCIALSLEGLIMVIKYNQLDLAGNLYYPVAIIISTALLLMALGVFLRCIRLSI